jgi:CheY-like chemotaxis protein
MRTMMLTVLEVAGYEVHGVRSGVDALALLPEWQPDVIVLDLAMPVMDGYDLLARRPGFGDLAAVPVVVVAPSTASQRLAQRLGARTVLERPHDVSHLRAAIAEAMQRGPHDAT